ncbi:MAG: hypothetical protein R2824_01730 [Saprospiraceae bacterium]|nr:hypothetical protein [Lewinella sp.]
MIELRYPIASTQVEDWQDDLKRLALAHKLVQDEQLEKPLLLHSGTEYSGREAITSYIRKLDEESEQWWYCVCDRS